MREKLNGTQELYGQYPTLFGGAKPPEFVDFQRQNRAFVGELIGPADSGIDSLAADTCAEALTATDIRLGRDIGQLGTQCENNGLWTAMPTPYHNGDGTRAAMLGTALYMDFVNQIDGASSPYMDRDTYLASLITAAFDDIVFGAHGRGGDEKASAEIATEVLRRSSLPPKFASSVRVGIEASEFNEATGRQNYNPENGYEAVQRASLVGDLWALGTPQSTVHLFHLLVENLWKPDSGYNSEELQVLRVAAVNEFVRSSAAPASISNAWHGQSVGDFLELAQRDDKSRQVFAAKVKGNGGFILGVHRYANVGDERVDELTHAGKRQNAKLQYFLGDAIERGNMTIGQAYRCALAYANGGRPLTAENVQPENISQLLLNRHSEDQLRAPLDVDAFWATYHSKSR